MKKDLLLGQNEGGKRENLISPWWNDTLDEIGDMSLNMQAKILRVLQEKEVTRIGHQTNRIDVRIAQLQIRTYNKK